MFFINSFKARQKKEQEEMEKAKAAYEAEKKKSVTALMSEAQAVNMKASSLNQAQQMYGSVGGYSAYIYGTAYPSGTSQAISSPTGSINSPYQNYPNINIHQMTGLKVQSVIVDAMGKAHHIVIDAAYQGIINQITYNHQCAYGGQHPAAKPAPTYMCEGDFSLDELSQAEEVIHEMEVERVV